MARRELGGVTNAGEVTQVKRGKTSEEYEIKSPSKQVKGNALRLKQFIKSKNIFSKSLRFWINGILVFTHDNVVLNLNNPTVPVLKANELSYYIKNKKSKIILSPIELKKIGQILLKNMKGNSNISSKTLFYQK